MLQTRQIIRFAILVVSLMFIGSIPAVDASKELSCGNFFWEIDSSRHSNNSDQSWIIEFYAPWDETGKKLDIMWSSLAEKTDVNFGRVQFHKCKVLAKYLGIESTRKILYLRGGNMIRFNGKLAEEDILHFLTISYQDEVELPLPESLGIWHSCKQVFLLATSDPSQLVRMLLSGEDDSMTIFLSASLLFIFSTFAVVYLVGRSVENAPLYSDTPEGRRAFEKLMKEGPRKEEDDDDDDKKKKVKQE